MSTDTDTDADGELVEIDVLTRHSVEEAKRLLVDASLALSSFEKHLRWHNLRFQVSFTDEEEARKIAERFEQFIKAAASVHGSHAWIRMVREGRLEVPHLDVHLRSSRRYRALLMRRVLNDRAERICELTEFYSAAQQQLQASADHEEFLTSRAIAEGTSTIALD